MKWFIEIKKRKFLKWTLVILALPLVLIIRFLRPIILFRFDRVHPQVGHTAGDLEIYLCSRDLGVGIPEKRHLDIFCADQIHNHELLNRFRKNLILGPYPIINFILHANRLIPGGKIHEIDTHMRMADRDIYGFLEKTEPHLNFSEYEIEQGEKVIEKMGIKPGEKFICLLVRDFAYLDDFHKNAARNASIENYVLMTETLAELGYYVVRMGRRMLRKMPSKHPRIFDYSFCDFKSDFLDIYLGYRCYFCVTTESGWDNIPRHLFRKPMVVTNKAPIAYIQSWTKNCLFIMKKHVDVNTERFLGIGEIVDREVHIVDQYLAKDVRLIENTPEEILEVVLEMVHRLDGIWKNTEQDEVFQKSFWDLFPKDSIEPSSKKPMHGLIRARMGAQFLRAHHEWLLR